MWTPGLPESVQNAFKKFPEDLSVEQWMELSQANAQIDGHNLKQMPASYVRALKNSIADVPLYSEFQTIRKLRGSHSSEFARDRLHKKLLARSKGT